MPGSSQPREQYQVYAFHGEILVTIQLFQNRTSEISADDTGQVRVGQVGIGQVGTGQVGVGQVGTDQAGTGQAGQQQGVRGRL